MRYSPLGATFLCLASALAVVSARTALAQEAGGAGAYPMNVEDRIAISGSRGRYITPDDDHIGRAGAFPMNNLDRIKRAEMAATRTGSYGAQPQPIAAQGFTPFDNWRYVQFQNRWWYYDQNSQWHYFSAGRWRDFQPPAAGATP
jgi:hypothetical protein